MVVFNMTYWGRNNTEKFGLLNVERGPLRCSRALFVSTFPGPAIAEVSRWLPSAAARDRSLVGSWGICGGRNGIGEVSSEYFVFPCQFSFHQMLHTHLSSGAGRTGQLVAELPSGLSLTPPHEIKKETIFRRSYVTYIKGQHRNVSWDVD
jgi:hypothetical protein